MHLRDNTTHECTQQQKKMDIMLWFVIALEIASKDTMLYEIASLMLACQLLGAQRKAFSYLWFFRKTC